MTQNKPSLTFAKRIRYIFEYIAARFLFFLFRILTFRLASNLGAAIAKLIFLHTNRTAIAKINIHLAMPDKTETETDEIVRNMWGNLGRNFAELPHVSTMHDKKLMKYASITGIENIHDEQKCGHGALYFTAHLGNWEIAPRIFHAVGHPVSIVYRRANNPGIEKMIQNARSRYTVQTLTKGPEGARRILTQLKNGHSIGMLVDQKMNDGVETNFFGKKAMTAPAIARLALKYKYPVIPVRVSRHNKFHFKVTVYPQLEIADTINRDNDIISLMQKINQMLEIWIKEDSGQWIWMHNRWS